MSGGMVVPSCGGKNEGYVTACQGCQNIYDTPFPWEVMGSTQSVPQGTLPPDEKDEYLPQNEDTKSKRKEAGVLGEIGKTLISYVIGIIARKYDISPPPIMDILQHLSVEPEVKVIKNALYQTTSALDAMEELTARGYDAKRAFHEIIRFVLNRNTKNPPKDVFVPDTSSYCWDVSQDDFREILKRYPLLKHKILQHELEILEKSVSGPKKDRVGNWIRSLDELAIERVSPDELGEEILSDSLTSTQERLRESYQQKNEVVESSLREWTLLLAKEMENVQLVGGEKEVIIKISDLGTIKIIFKTADSKAELLAIKKQLYSIAKKLDGKKVLEERELSFISGLIETNPQLSQKLDFNLKVLSKEIKTSEAKVRIYKLALMPEGAGLRKALKLIQENPSRPFRIILPDGTRLKAQWVNNGLVIKTVPEASFPPYRFKRYDVLRIGTENYEVIDGMVIKDSSGRQSFIIYDDILQLEALYKKALQLSGKEGELVVSELEARLEDLKVAWLSINPDSTQARSATGSLKKRSAMQAELNWGRALLENLSDLVNRVNFFCDKSSYSTPQKTLIGERGITSAAEIDSIVAGIRQKYEGYFLDANKGETSESERYNRLLDRLSGLLKSQAGNMGGEQNGGITATLTELEGLVKSQMAKRTGYKWNKAMLKGRSVIDTPDLITQTEFWLTEGASVVEAGSLTEAQKLVIAGGASKTDLAPSLERARRFAAQGSYVKAINEYIRYANLSTISKSDRIVALMESVPASLEMGDTLRAEWALRQVAEILKGNGEMPEEAKKVLKWLRYESEWGKLIDIPFDIPMRGVVEGPDSARLQETTKLVSDALTGTEKVPYITERVSFLSTNAVAELTPLVNELVARTNGRYSHEFLMRLATLTEVEFRSFVEGFPPGLETVYLCRFYERSRPLVVVHGYDVARLQTAENVQYLSRQDPSLFIIEEGRKRLPPVKPTESGVLELYPAATKPPPSYRWLSDVAEVGGNVLFGAATFMLAKQLVNMTLPTPTQNWEALFQNHLTILAAIDLDASIQKGVAKYFNLETTSGMTGLVNQGFSWRQFGEGLGLGILLSKFFSGSAMFIGADQNTAEAIGLVGTGAVLAGYRPILKVAVPTVYRELVIKTPSLMAAVEANGLAPYYSSSAALRIASFDKLIRKFGLWYLIVETSVNTIDAVVDLTVNDLDSAIRNMEESERKRIIRDRSLFGDAPDAGFFEQTGYTLFGFADTLVPSGWYKLCRDVTGSEWRRQKKQEVLSHLYDQYYGVASVMMVNAAISLDNALITELNSALNKTNPPEFEEVIKRVIDDEKAMHEFKRWQEFASVHLRNEHQNWLFTNKVISNGEVIKSNALVHWMELRFKADLVKFENLLKKAYDASDEEEKGELSKRLGVIKKYTESIETRAMFYRAGFRGKAPHQME